MDHRQQLQIQRQSSSSGHQQQYQYNQQQSSSNNNQQFSQKHQGAPTHHHQISNQQQQYNMQQHAQQNQHPHHSHYTQQQMQHANQAAQFQSQHSQSYHSSQLSQQQHHMQQSHSSSSYQPPVINGPRAKCNQVIYEAITKSCEIAVRGRCTNLLDDNMFNTMANSNMNVGAGNSRGYSDGMINTHNNTGRDIQTAGSFGRRNTITTPHHSDKRRSWNYGGNQPQQSSTSSTSSRFNIEVNEVPTIRSTVSSTWKKSIHLPLRLDIYYEYDSCYDQQQETLGQQEGAPPPPPQRELLERWCIDYIPSTSSSTQSQSLHNSLSSSPSTSPYSSPYSSRILTGAITNSPRNDNNKSSSSSSMSQLRQVCKRIVILLRSLHCMTRMLPAYQLKCALISNMLGAVDGVVTQQQQHGHHHQNQQSIGWGHIGYSIHVGDEQTQYDPPLPSPSFQRQSLPSVSTPYGNMVLSVMYDATLQPSNMLYDIIERRNGWLHSLHQQRHGGQYNQQQQHIPPTIPTNTQPIPINTHVVGQHVSNSPGPLTINSLPRNVSRRREYGSCPPAALMMGGHPSPYGSGGPASFGSNTQQQQRSRAASINIISDYHHSPRLKPTSASPGQKNHLTPSSANNSSPATGQNKRVMSGLSLAMMNEDDNTSPVEDQVPPPSSSPHDNDHQLHPQAQREVDALILPFGSPMTRAAFHNPPPILSNDEGEVQPQQQQAYSSGVEDRGTHFFKQHGGYGYGYNGSNLQFTDERQQQTKEDKVPPPPFTPSLGLSISPNPRVLSNNTPPPPSPGITSLRQSRSGTPPTSVLSSRPLISSPRQYHQQGLIDSRSGSRHRTASTSSAVDLLPPVSTLDMLGKSPFSSKSRKGASSEKEGDANTSSSDSGGGEKLLSYIPRVVNDKSDSTGVSTLGGGEGGIGGSSTNPSSSDTGQQTNSSGNRDRNNTDSGEQLPFAVDDDDDDNPTSKGKSSSSPLKASGIKANRELWGSTKADMLGDDGPGGITLGVAETMAVSSLAHRCATDSKVRLRMFESSPAVGGNELTNTASVSRPSIKDQLSDFKTFGASLMMDSTNESDKDE